MTATPNPVEILTAAERALAKVPLSLLDLPSCAIHQSLDPCVEAGRRFRRNRNMLDSKEEEVDETRRSVAGAVREGKGYFVTDAILDE